MQIYLVKWYDTQFLTHGWQSKEVTTSVPPVSCASIGVIAEEDDERINLNPNINSLGDFSQGIIIYKANIKKMWKLKVEEVNNG